MSLQALIGAGAILAARRERAREAPSPAALARWLDPEFNITATIALLSDIAVRWVREPDQRDVISTPPRTGKSQTLVVWTTVWAFTQNPDLEMVIISHSDDLAKEHSGKARKIILEHGDKLGYSIASDKTAVGRWRIEGCEGSMLAAGFSSGVTGFGADCVAPDTRIHTEHGDVTAEQAFNEQHTQIWAFDHASGVAGWRRVEASRRIDGREVVTVRTVTGGVLRCTSDHRVYTRRGYVPAGDLQGTDQILALSRSAAVRPLRAGVPGAGLGHPQGHRPRGDRNVLRRIVPVGGVRRREADGVLCGVFGPGPQVPEDDVLGCVPASALRIEETRMRVPAVRPTVQADQPAPHVLQPRVRERGALTTDDRQRQLEIQGRCQLPEAVPADAPNDPGTRRRGVCGVPGGAGGEVRPRRRDGDAVPAGGASHQRGEGGQPAGESDHAVPDVPFDPSQVQYDTVSSVTRDGGGPVSVYDFQVEGTSNFFADGLVVHNCMIIDDIVKDAATVDSDTKRKAILTEYQGSLANRIHPGGSCMIVMTRWHSEDLAGTMLKQEPERWNHTNIPAISEPGVPDALGRPPGVTMTSALGYTKKHYAQFRKTVGQRMWYAQFMGVPSTPAGTLVKQSWFDDWRLDCAPTRPVMTVVSVDPAESGKGDECGLVASSITADGVVALIADRSALMTSDEWASAAVDLAISVGASQIAVEGFTARKTYTRMVNEAIDRARVAGRLRHAVRVTAWPEKGKPRPGDAIARSGPLLQAIETGRARLAGRFPEFEGPAVLWQRGQHQPDRLAAWVIGHDVLVESVGQAWDIAGPPEPAQLGASGAGLVEGSVTVLDDWMSRRVG